MSTLVPLLFKIHALVVSPLLVYHEVMSKPFITFLIVLGLAIIIRLALALSWHGYWGVDGGASLLTVNAVLGDEPTHAGFPKPPLAPGILLAPFVLAFGTDIGYKIWSAIFAILPLIPVYLLTRKYVGVWPAVGTVLFASVDWTWAEMFVTGAHPLTAFALIGMAWYSMAAKADEVNQHWNIRNSWTRHDLIIILSIGLVPWVNQTTAGLALIVLPIYYLALCGYKRSPLFHVLIPCLLAGILAIGALPWYMQTLPGSDILTYDGPILYWAWGINTFQGFFIALPLGVFVIWKCPDYRIRALGIMLLVFAALVPWLSFDEVLINPPYRARYMMALAFYPVMAWVVFNIWIPKAQLWLTPKDGFPTGADVGKPSLGARKMRLTFFSIATVIAFVYMSSVWVYIVLDQAHLSAMVTPETAQALEGLRNGTIQNSQTRTAPNDPKGIATNSFTLSLWVAALNKVNSPFLTTAPPPPAYVDSDVLLRCSFGWIDGCDGRHAADLLGISYILVEERFPHYNQFAPGNYLAPDNQWAVTANTEWLKLVYSAGTTRLYEVD
jgi:hypothetical protein